MSILEGLFTAVLNMSITASLVAAGVILVRQLLRRAPRVLSYALWAIVFFRLICPVSFSSQFSALEFVGVPQSAGGLGYVHDYAGVGQPTATPANVGGSVAEVSPASPTAPAVIAARPQPWHATLSLVWAAGVVALLGSAVIAYVRTGRRIRSATVVADGVLETDAVDTAFVYGLIRPRICVPAGVAENELPYILEHERVHIRRRDYLAKPVAYLALIIHWFNPLIWLSFLLMSRDMEMACDESVLRRLGADAKHGYLDSLLALSAPRVDWPAANPIGFAGSHVKARIKNVLNYRRPTVWVVAAAVVLVSAAGIAFAANPNRLPAPEMFAAVDKGAAAWALTRTTVHHSGNGGRSWADVSPELASGSAIGASEFLDARTGWLLITPPATADEAQPLPVTVLHTTDAGRTWARSSITVSQQAWPATVTFVDANHGWAMISYGAACGSEGVEIFSTADGGANWTFCAGAMPPTEHGLPFGGIKSGLSFRDSNTGWLTGYDASDRPYIFITHDGGGTWVRQSLPIPQGLSSEGGSSAPRPPVFFAGQAAILPVTFSDKLVLYSSVDAGATWTPTATTTGNAWSIISVADAYATDGATIVRTADGGRSWATVELGGQLTDVLATGYTIRQLDFSTPLKGWALLTASESGSTHLLKTTDGGRTWR